MSGHLYLVGYMGCGKSTVGRLLADRLGQPFVDLDLAIEAAAGRTIPLIFESEGEAAFRRLETGMLEGFIDAPGSVVATGGGCFSSPHNRRLIAASGISFWLDVDLPILRQRCLAASGRPLATGREVFDSLYQQRLSDYRQADFRIPASQASPLELCQQIESLMAK